MNRKSVFKIASAALFAFLSVAPAGATSYYSVSWGNPQFPEGFVDLRGRLAPNLEVNARAGIFGLRATGGSSPFNFLAVCVDAREYLFAQGSPQLYAMEQLQNYTQIPNSPSFPNSAVTLSAQRRTLLEQLYFVAGNAAIQGNNISSAAFQLAVWEIATETLDSNPYNGDLTLSSGAVRVTGSGDDIQARNQANAYLAMLNQSTDIQRLYIWSPVRAIRNSGGTIIGYERVVGQELLTPAPEPGLYAVMAAGLVAAYWRAKKKPATPADEQAGSETQTA